MNHRQEPSILISAYYHLGEALQRNSVSHVVSMLGPSDKLDWPPVGDRRVLRLEFDDISYSSGKLVAVSRDQIAELIEFARGWNDSGSGCLALQCRAGSARSPAAGMIAAAALGRPDTEALVLRVATARAYFRPNTTMLRLADSLLKPSPGLVDLARSIPVPIRIDKWAPVAIPLDLPAEA